MKKVNWANWVLLIFFLVLLCIDAARENYMGVLCNGIVAIFNMFLILEFKQRCIMDEQDEQKKREEEIIKMLKEKENKI